MNSYRERINEKAKHLTPEEINEIMHLYYDKSASMKELKEKYELKGIALSDLHYIFPPESLNDKTCMYCGTSLVRNRTKRNKSKYNITENPYCPFCGHEDSSSCNCRNCVENKKKTEETETDKKIQFLLKSIDLDKYTAVEFDQLSLLQKVYLGTFLRAGINKDFTEISPLGDYQYKMFPSDEYMHSAFRELYYKHIIEIHPKSRVVDFTVDYEKDSFSFKWKNIFLYPNIQSESLVFDKIIAQLLNPSEWKEIYTEAVLPIWKEIIYWECVDLFIYRMEAYEFEYTIGKETKAFFEDIINYFPISQIYSIIWNGAKNAAAYYMESKVPKKQAANSVLSRMRNAADKIASGQWNRYDYNRPKECQQSLISEYFFNSILKICDQGWNRVPSILYKPEDQRIDE